MGAADTDRHRRRLALVTAVWVLGFGIGAATHLFELATAGIGVYGDAPELVRWFWVALTVVDPVIVVLLLVRRRAGVLCGVTTMVADVLVNWSAAFAHPALAGPGLVTQPAFLLFLLLTARPLWRSNGATRPRRRHPDD